MNTASAPQSDLIEVYRQVLTVRRIEEALSRLTSYHPAIGEEAVVVGAFHGLWPGDYISPHYRGAVPAAYLRGADLRRLIAGVYGKATGYGGGRFRGDICMPLECNVIGLFCGILASSVGLATGAALSQKQLGSGNVVVATFGEGTSNLGLVHESLNLAASLALPIVYVCQNNQYAMSMSSRAAMKCASVADRAVGYGVPGLQVDGNDVIAVHQAVQAAVARARSGQGPTLIEARTYRVSGHRAAEKVTYQDEDERRAWQLRDPLDRIQRTVTARQLLDEKALKGMNEEIQEQIDRALRLAEADPDPAPNTLSPESVFAPAPAFGDLS
jgi:TPP-dependent pyruvate/acetoin dehydrogenase alpha subunit